MWALWIVTMLLVHLQFKYCGAFAVGFLKMAEAALIEGFVILYIDYDEEMLTCVVEKIPKFTS